MGFRLGGVGQESATLIFAYTLMIKIINVRNATSDEWDIFWNSCQTATYYHSREWAEVWQEYTNNRISPVPKMITFSDDVTVLLPFSKQKYYRGLINRYSLTGPPALALPYYGSWITNDKLTDDHVRVLSDYLLNTYRNLAWRLNPYDSTSEKITIASKYSKRRSLVTYTIDLSQGEEKIYSNFKKSCRNQIKQSLKNNLTITEGTDISHWRKYYDIYCDTIRRWGAKTIYKLDWRIFEILFNKNNPAIKLWIVWYEGKAIAGDICFYSHGKIISWHIASLTDYHRLRPVHYFKYMITRDGIRNKYDWFDFDTAGKNEGLRKFKESFGTEEKMCDMIISWHPIVHKIFKYIK
jgi:hypothetical protein